MARIATVQKLTKCVPAIAFLGVLVAILANIALAGQDKYTLQVPGGLPFSDFKGYEHWQTVSVSKTEHAFAVILANPVMIDAYRAGVPANGKPFPRRLQNGENPLEAGKECGGPRSDNDGAGHTDKR